MQNMVRGTVRMTPSRGGWSIAVVVALVLGCAAAAGAQVGPDQPGARPPSTTPGERPRVGVAFGGGSARGIAHVGVIRWFEEHHIPIDVAAGTSMGGLIGGSFATGMDADEIQEMLRGLDWDQMFGYSGFAFKNVRRKADVRAYPSHLEFGLKKGVVLPTAFNSGQQVDLLIARITAPYWSEPSFATLPTPFKTVAVDLRTAQPVILDRGSLARSMRATMSLPGIFPPVEIDQRVLVDGGAMDNIPADVVREMGAQTVIAVNVGDLTDRERINYSILGLAGATIDAMMRANTKKALVSADIVLDVSLAGFGSLDWRKSDALIDAGYQAADAMKDRLLPLSVGPQEWERWRARRQAARKTVLAEPSFVRLVGVGPVDARRMEHVLSKHVGKALDIPSLELDLTELSGLDRYETILWHLVANDTGAVGLQVSAIPKPYAPPFMMLGLNLENTTSDQFQLGLAARYLRFDVLTSGSELRLDGVIGADPSFGAGIYQPVWRATFLNVEGGVQNQTFNLVKDDEVVARYSQTNTAVSADLGVNLGRDSDLRVGVAAGRLDAKVSVGDPGLPTVSGKKLLGRIVWRIDTQDSNNVPSRGVAGRVKFEHVFDGPDVDDPGDPDTRQTNGLSQLSGEATWFWRWRERNRLFVLAGGGTSFSDRPMSLDQFALGRPLHLGAFPAGEVRGDHYLLATAGVFRELKRLPDFFGGPVFAGAWLEMGDAFESFGGAKVRTHASGGIVVDTLVGPVLLAASSGFDGRWRTYVGVGRLFR